MRRIAVLLLFLCTPVFAELSVVAEYPAEAKYLRGKKVYPEYLLDMSRAADWKRIGSTGGHSLKLSEADCPGRPGERGLLFSAKIDKKSAKAPGWVAWEAKLDPELNIVGADEVEFEIYPLQKFPFGVTARFGSTKGFGQLPCTWSDVVKNLEPKCWHTVRIPVKKSRLSVDTLRFDFNARNDAVPHAEEMSMIVAAIRFLPAPHPATAVYSTRMNPGGFLINVHPLEMADNAALEYSVELAVEREQQAELNIECGGRTFSQTVSLKAPYTMLNVRLSESFPPGDYRLKTTLSGQGGIIAESAEPMPLSFFSSEVMNDKRQQLKLRLAGLEQRRAALNIPAELPGITAAAAGLFLDHFIPDDFNRQKKYRIAMEELNDIAGMLDELDSELTAYEKGQVEELPVPAYDPDRELAVENGVICQDGRPILLIGPLAGLPALSWSRHAPRLGFNSLVVETNMNDWLNFEKRKDDTVKKSPDLIRGEARSYRGESSAVKDYLDRCRANRLAANLLLSSHYCKDVPEDLANARSPYAGHNNFDWNVLSDGAKEAFRRMYGNILPFLQDKPHLASLGTANEPGYEVKAGSEDFRKGFIAWLREKYGDAGALNRAWGSKFAAMEEITLKDAAKLQAKVDWTEYQSLAVNRFYGFLRDQLLASLPEKQIWVKLMGNLGYEMLDEEDNIALGQNVSGSDSAWEIWLDHLRSLFPDRPVTNHEWHFIREQYTSNREFLAMRMYQGVTRGIQSANIWRGMRADWESKGYGHVESFSRYPFGLEGIGRTALRLRMHYPVLLRMQSLDGGRVRIYYDKKNHLLQGGDYEKSIRAAYDRLRINPAGVRFTYPGRELRGVELVAAGKLRHLPQETALALAEWVRNGGTLWLDGPAEWSNYAGGKLELPETFAAALQAGGVRQFGKGSVVTLDQLRGYSGMMPGVIAWSGELPNAGVECRVIPGPDGKMEYLSIVNLADAEQKVRLIDGGNPVTVAGKDIWNNNESVELRGEFTLKPFAIKLIRVD